MLVIQKPGTRPRSRWKRPLAIRQSVIPQWLRDAYGLFWSIDAFLFVLAYTVLLLLIPTPSPKWRSSRVTRDPVDP